VNGLIVDDQVEQTTGDLTENRLMWPSVQRSDLNSIFTCQATNTHLVEPRESSFVLDLHCKFIFQLPMLFCAAAAANVDSKSFIIIFCALICCY